MLSVEGDCCVLIPQSADTYLKLSTSEEKGKWKVFVMHLFLFINQQKKAEELPPTNNTHLYVFMEILPKSKCLVVSVCIGQILRFGRWGLQTSLQGSLREVLHLYINEPQTGGAHRCSGFHIHMVIMFHLGTCASYAKLSWTLRSLRMITIKSHSVEMVYFGWMWNVLFVLIIPKRALKMSAAGESASPVADIPWHFHTLNHYVDKSVYGIC